MKKQNLFENLKMSKATKMLHGARFARGRSGTSLRFALVGLLTFSVLMLAAPLTFANGNLTLMVKDPDPYTNNQSWFVYNEKGGRIIEDTAIIKNSSNKTMKAHIYSVDATSNDTGSFILKLESDPKKNLGAWTTLETRDVVIAAQTTVEVPFKITVPANLTPGQYFGGIVMEEMPADDILADISQHGQANVIIKTRVGARMYLTVPGAIDEKVTWPDFIFRNTLGKDPHFKFTIINEGNVSYEPKAIVEILNSKGEVLQKFEKILGESLPNTNIEPIVSWEKKPLIGNFEVKATITFFKKSQDLTYNLDGEGPKLMSKSIQVLIIPWGIIIWSIIVILVVAGIFFWKHLKVKKLIENCEEYILGPNEDILSIAASRNIDWKKLAKINKLTPPYILKEGSILFVPKKESATIPLYDPNITPPVSTEVKKDPDPNSEK